MNSTDASWSGSNTTMTTTAVIYPDVVLAAMSMREIYPWVLVAVGLPGNAACLLTIVMMRTTSATIYVAVLALADTLALLIKFLFVTMDVYVWSATYCHLQYGSNYLSCLANWILVLIALQRLFVVCYPLRVRATFTRARICISVAILAALLFVVLLAPTFAFHEWDAANHTCNTRSHMEYVKKAWDTQLISVFYFFLPFAFISIATSVTTVVLFRHRRHRQAIRSPGPASAGHGNGSSDAERSVCLMLVCTALAFLVLTFPAVLFHTFLTHRYDIYKLDEWAEHEFVRQMVTFLSDANHAVNFFIYFLSASGFRQCFLQTLRRCCPCCPWRQASAPRTTESTNAEETVALQSSRPG